MKRKVFATLLLFLVIACATSRQPGDTALLAFLSAGQTTRAEVLQRLGQPSARFENDAILTYRIGGDADQGFYVRDAPGTWYKTNYSLVLVFGDGGYLERHTLVPVR